MMHGKHKSMSEKKMGSKKKAAAKARKKK